jgi:membrane-associated phospholipid phosphatase
VTAGPGGPPATRSPRPRSARLPGPVVPWPWLRPPLVTGLAWRAALVVVVGILLAVAGRWLWPELATSGLDRRVTEELVAWRTPAVLTPLQAVSWLAKTWFVAPLLLVVGIPLARRSGRMQVLWVPATAGAGAFAISVAVKLAVARPRPTGDLTLIDAVGPSFPSGHVLRATAIYGAVAWLVHRAGAPVGVRVGTWAAAVALVAVVTLTRTVEGAHWPSDLVASAALGGLWLVLLVRHLGPDGVWPTRPRPDPPG